MNHPAIVRMRIVLIGLALAAMAGCASVPRDPAARAEFKATNDPLEPLNRRIFAFNLSADRYVIKPVAKGYRQVLPQPVRDGLRHAIDNLNEPLILVNCVLQGRLKSAAVTGGRFIVNSTVGVGGLGEVAERWKMPKQVGDFGQTLWAWGFPEGPYLVLPLFGPSSPRDAIGQGIDVYLDPVRYVVRNNNYPNAVSNGKMVVDGVDRRERNLDTLDELQKESIDFYASLRSLYRQNRAAELHNGKPQATLPKSNFYDDPGP